MMRINLKPRLITENCYSLSIHSSSHLSIQPTSSSSYSPVTSQVHQLGWTHTPQPSMDTEKTAISKAVAIEHMNKGHQDALSLYLRAFNHVPADKAQSARLETFTSRDLVVATPTARYTIPLDPPLKSETASELRSRAVSMHKESLLLLGLSPVIIKQYKAPRGVQAVAFAVLLFLFVGFSRAANFAPGSIIYGILGPSVARFCESIQPLLFRGLVAAHGLETVLFSFLRLFRHGVKPLSAVWAKWSASVFVEGIGAWSRFDAMVKQEKEAVMTRKKV